jgi:hypothetical protein
MLAAAAAPAASQASQRARLAWGARCQHGQREDEHQAGQDERRTARQGTAGTADTPRAEDRELSGRRTGQQVAGGQRVLEFGGVQPLLPLDAQITQQPDVRRRAAEPDAADPAPFPHDREQAGPRRHLGGMRRRGH